MDWSLSRRYLLAGSAAAALVRPVFAAGAKPDLSEAGAKPVPLETVRLTPSLYLDAVTSNCAYLHRLEPDRLLHNFRKQAGLVPKGEVYGGWESDTIAGHTLGHYLSALSLMHAQTGDEECKRRVEYIVDDLAACQAAHGDGYVAGFTRRSGDAIEDGKRIFPEIVAGDIRVMPFDLNGCWVPLYNFHKTFAGLFDAERHCGNARAREVALGLAVYIDGVFAQLSDEQVQHILDCEHGGLNESFAELYDRTGNIRWMALAARLYHRKVLNPLAEGRDELADLHANTQIPKVIGVARLYDVGGQPEHQKAARFFWQAVTRDHSYVIGGHGDREYFQPPRTISKYVTEQTCESCNSYNMLKLTRQLYRWAPDAALFDYYERAHINHILAQHDPSTGMFTYMMPLMEGAKREFSTAFDDFWCCMGTGMESHSKHGDSVYWERGDTLFVNLFVPSQLAWRGGAFELSTSYPLSEDVTFTVRRPARFALALRLPGWCAAPRLSLNGKPSKIERRDGYAMVRRRWRAGDTIALTLPMTLRTEPTPDDPRMVAYLKGPVVQSKVGGNLVPFFRQYGEPAKVYFKTYSQEERAASNAEALRLSDLDSHSTDIAELGDDADEKAHALASKTSYAVVYRGRKGRDARSGGFFELDMKPGRGNLALNAIYSGDDKRRLFHILVEGERIATQALEAESRGGFIERNYPIPPSLVNGKSRLRIRVEPEPGHSAGPIFGLRLLSDAPPPSM
ncbi:MAG: glycoside hydrolase family 127 protein [Alphaproteobacteria bacterium]|nr:glycoside hydrolase family 127 protein [Alphaproteobacteria bacterium]